MPRKRCSRPLPLAALLLAAAMLASCSTTTNTDPADTERTPVQLADFSTAATEMDAAVQAVKTALEPHIPADSWVVHGERSFSHCEAENTSSYSGELWHAEVQLAEEQLDAVTTTLGDHGFSPRNLITPDGEATGFSAEYVNENGDTVDLSNFGGTGLDILARTACRLDRQSIPREQFPR